MTEKRLSANTLFHFTPKVEYLQSILVNGLYPRLSRETIHGSDASGWPAAEICIPMVCFCDIPLSQIRNHIEAYGGYAVGLTKAWGLANSVAPVLYYYANSPTFDAMLRATDAVNSIPMGTRTSDGKDPQRELVSLSMYFKPYEGHFEKTGLDTRFYDEREWRFIPRDYLTHLLRGEDMNDEKKKRDMNDRLVDQALLFEPSDVRYIVVSDEAEIYPMLEYIQRQKGDCSFHQVQLLTTKIITTKQVMEDF